MPNEQPRQRRIFDEAFKRDAVALLLQGDRRVKQLAQELGVSPATDHLWTSKTKPTKT